MNERLLLAARQARDQLRTVQRDLVASRSAFEESVRRLHEAGASMEELAAALDETRENINRILSGTGTDLLRCSYCGSSQKEVRTLIAGPGTYICSDCVDLASRVIDGDEPSTADSPGLTTVPSSLRVLCGICGKDRNAVVELVTGPEGSIICDECLSLCREIIQSE